MNKYKPIIWIAVILIGVLALISGCNNRDNITSSQEIQTTKTNYTFNIDAHNYILLEYFKQVDYIDHEKIIEDNKAQYVINNQIDYELAAEFVVDNIDLFVDLDLWEKVTEDAEVEFNLPTGSLYVPFSNGLIKYADLDGTHGGYNFFMQDSTDRLNEMTRYFDDNIKVHLSVLEYDNLLSLIALSHQATTEYSDMQDFYNDALADTTFSEEYQEILTFGLNDINFKKYLDNNQDDFNTCYTDIWGGSADIAVYSSSYHTNQIHCTGCCPGIAIPQTISHSQHLSMSQGLSSHASAEAGFWCGIIQKLNKIGDLL